jgi:hypothetical protein
MKTVEQLQDEARILREAKSGMRKERYERIKSRIMSVGRGIDRGVEKSLSGAVGLASKYGSKKIKSKAILRKSKTTINIKNNQPAEYVPLYFQSQVKQERDNFFLS